MFKKVVIVNAPTTEDYHQQYLSIDFTDGTFVNLSEEELKNAAKLAKKGLRVTFNEEYLKRLSN